MYSFLDFVNKMASHRNQPTYTQYMNVAERGSEKAYISNTIGSMSEQCDKLYQYMF
jgi:hypothetical protein